MSEKKEEIYYAGQGFIWEGEYGPSPHIEINVQQFLSIIENKELAKYLRNYTNKETGVRTDYVKLKMVKKLSSRGEYDTHFLKLDTYIKKDKSAETPAANTGASEPDLY